MILRKISHSLISLLIYLAIAVLAFAVFVLAYTLVSIPLGDDLGAWVAGFIGIIAFPALAVYVVGRFRKPVPEEIDQAIEEGRVETDSYKVSRAVVIQEFEDEGYFCLLEVDDSQTLCLQGQYLWDIVDETSFPAENIQVLWDRFDGETYTVRVSGKAIEPEKVLPPLNDNQRASDRLPYDRQLFTESIESVLARIDELKNDPIEGV